MWNIRSVSSILVGKVLDIEKCWSENLKSMTTYNVYTFLNEQFCISLK